MLTSVQNSLCKIKVNSVGGASIDKNLALAGMVGLGALASQTGKDFIIPRIPSAGMSPAMKKVAENAVGPVICGGATVALEKLVAAPESSVASLISGTSNQSNTFTNFAVGAGAYLAADYTYNSLMK